MRTEFLSKQWGITRQLFRPRVINSLFVGINTLSERMKTGLEVPFFSRINFFEDLFLISEWSISEIAGFQLIFAHFLPLRNFFLPEIAQKP